MDSSSGRSPRRELQGPRPTPLRVQKDSHKIRKPPIAPQTVPGQHQHQHGQPRPPVIIYTVSPKIIHADPNEFMSLVQRLTGPNSGGLETSPTTSLATSYPFQEPSGGAISPAARFASIEKTNSPAGRKAQIVYDDHGDDNVGGIDIGTSFQRTGQFPGILSPNPNTLPPIPPNFFSTQPNDYNNNPLSYFNDFSPGLFSNRNYYSNDNNFAVPSPFLSPQINMPSPNTLDLFNSLFDN